MYEISVINGVPDESGSRHSYDRPAKKTGRQEQTGPEMAGFPHSSDRQALQGLHASGMRINQPKADKLMIPLRQAQD
jgi:hypothetical protein